MLPFAHLYDHDKGNFWACLDGLKDPVCADDAEVNMISSAQPYLYSANELISTNETIETGVLEAPPTEILGEDIHPYKKGFLSDITQRLTNRSLRLVGL